MSGLPSRPVAHSPASGVRYDRAPVHAEDRDVNDIARRYETIGDLDAPPQPADPARQPRSIEDCVRENERHRRLGIEVICRPTWEDIESADREAQADPRSA